MKCNENSSAARACPKELEGKSPFEACQIVEKKQKEWYESAASVTPFGFLSNLIGAVGSSNETITNNIKETGVSIDQKQLTESLSACDAQVKMVQSNLVDTRECDAQNEAQIDKLTGYLNEATVRKDYEGAEFIMKAIQKLKDANQTGTIDQSNDAELTIKCKVNAVLSALAKADVTVENVAMMDILQKASGPMTSNSANTNNCNKTFIKQTGCQYLSNKSCCMTEFESTQSNVKLGCPQGGTQTNRFVANLSCDAGSTTEAKIEAGADVKNKDEITTSQTAEMPMWSSGSSSICCLCIVIVVGVGFAWFWYSSQTSEDNPSFAEETLGDDQSSWDTQDEPTPGMRLDVKPGAFTQSLPTGRSSFSKRRR
jgi:hypothetical protein